MSIASTDSQVVVTPRESDSVTQWLDPWMAQRLAQAGLLTLGAVTQRIGAAGPRWWYPVRGLGERRAERLAQWLQANALI